MKTIIDKITGKVLYASLNEVDLKDNEMLIDSLLTENFVNPYWNFANGTFYENATEQEIFEASQQNVNIDEVLIDLLSKQVSAMTDTEKNQLLQNLLL